MNFSSLTSSKQLFLDKILQHIDFTFSIPFNMTILANAAHIDYILERII